MKLWRKLAKKEENGSRTGRMIKQSFLMQEQALKFGIKTYPLLNALFVRGGIIAKAEQQVSESKE